MLKIIEQTEVLSTILLCAVVYVIGHSMIHANPRCRVWGIRIAALAHLGYVGFRLAKEQSLIIETLLEAIFRGLLLSWLVVGLAWIALKILVVVFDLSVWPLRNAWIKRQDRLRLAEREREKAEKLAEMDRLRALIPKVAPAPPPTRKDIIVETLGEAAQLKEVLKDVRGVGEEPVDEWAEARIKRVLGL
jgi:hypothetical protein